MDKGKGNEKDNDTDNDKVKSESNDKEDEKEIFRFRGAKRNIDLHDPRYTLFPSISNMSDPQKMEEFLTHGGIELTSAEETAVLRLFTTFRKVFPTQVFVNKGEKNLTGFLAGKSGKSVCPLFPLPYKCSRDNTYKPAAGLGSFAALITFCSG